VRRIEVDNGRRRLAARTEHDVSREECGDRVTISDEQTTRATMDAIPEQLRATPSTQTVL
jgi:hypothetical protein